MMGLVHLLSSFWLANFKEFAIFTLGGSALACALMGILVGWLVRLALRYPARFRPFLFAAVWTVWEWFKSSGFLAYPWGTLVQAARGLNPLIQIADVTGTWGISFCLALCSALIAEGGLALADNQGSIAKRTFAKTAAIGASLLLVACAYGAIRLVTLPKPQSTLDVVIVQQNVDPWDGGLTKSILRSQALTREAIAAAGGVKPDLVVWSESILTAPYVQSKPYYDTHPKGDPLGPFLAEIDAPLLVGSPVVVNAETNDYSNSVILIAPTGEQLDWFGKIQLVPFAEYMPFTEYEAVRKFFDGLVGFSKGWTPGSEIKSMSLRDKAGAEFRFATPICFEDAFSALVARLHDTGSNLIVNLTNDAWSKTDSAEMQHFAIASFRTIELRTTMVRSTNGGYSVVIGPDGRILDDLPLFQSASKLVRVPIYRNVKTFYARFGDWFPALAALVLLLVFAFRQPHANGRLGGRDNIA